MKTAEPGSISHGTMRPQDLIPVFLDALAECDPEAAQELRDEIPPAAFENDDNWFWDTDVCMFLLNEDLFDALNVVAPQGYYFGSHPGDGSDFGFWPIEEE